VTDYRIAVVCLGNICRSPIADVVLRSKLAGAGLAHRASVASFGTGGWHRGEPMDQRAAATLRQAGYDGSSHRARQITASHLADFDLVLAMDSDNLADLLGLGRPGMATIALFRDFDPQNPGADVPDPYYGGLDGFEEVLRMVERTADVLVARLAAGTLP
jgi:protein-tyrosine phosphatase